jgi:O-antigen biosynthesis protein
MNKSEQSDINYYENERQEIFDLVDTECETILDVGCGKGKLGSKLKKQKSNRKVIGIEYNSEIASEARKVLDEVLTGDIEILELPFGQQQFDCIIFGDVLEHLRKPEYVLQRMKRYLKPNGKIICSIPNMRHYTVILRLLRRGWVYEDSGHFDKTHLRFFSLRSMKEMIENSGFYIIKLLPRIDASKKMKILNRLFLNYLEEFVAFHYLIVASQQK